MRNAPHDSRVFLFLQGPHGPFFARLAGLLRQSGAACWRVGFNAGDRLFWPDRSSYLPYRGGLEDWPDVLARIVAERGVTDIVLYGDTRPIHAAAAALARVRGLPLHVFEEGYMRPYWVSYERGGSNGHSRLMAQSVTQMAADLRHTDIDAPQPPAHWGDMRQHIAYGALYHGCVWLLNRGYPRFTPHRGMPVSQEFRHYLNRLLFMPASIIARRRATRRIRAGGYPYHLALMQLDHDASFRMHSPLRSQRQFIEMVVAGFAAGAPAHHHLVFKAHPLEDGRAAPRRMVAAAARAEGVAGRVHYVRGGKLAGLLNEARSAVTVNSTAAQQVLWRGIPLKIFGTAVYAKPEFVSDQSLTDFFADPRRPDTEAYRLFRRYLLETSQVPGGFYSARGRRALLRHVVDMVLAPHDPYDALRLGTAAPRQQLRVVR
ncbi:MAG: capsule biosynthesis protein CapA [Roseivivax sp.]|nr:capsule biosynthesis protein CapA [Roseivivax sp.]